MLLIQEAVEDKKHVWEKTSGGALTHFSKSLPFTVQSIISDVTRLNYISLQ